MPPQPPPPEGVARAWDLYGQFNSYRQVAERLCAEGYRCNSQETARSWVAIGRQAHAFIELLDREETRIRMIAGLEQDMAMLRRHLDAGSIDFVQGFAQLKWLYDRIAKLVGTDAPTRLSVEASAAHIDPAVVAAVRATVVTPEDEIARQEAQGAARDGSRNGSRNGTSRPRP